MLFIVILIHSETLSILWTKQKWFLNCMCELRERDVPEKPSKAILFVPNFQTLRVHVHILLFFCVRRGEGVLLRCGVWISVGSHLGCLGLWWGQDDYGCWLIHCMGKGARQALNITCMFLTKRILNMLLVYAFKFRNKMYFQKHPDRCRQD